MKVEDGCGLCEVVKTVVVALIAGIVSALVVVGALLWMAGDAEAGQTIYIYDEQERTRVLQKLFDRDREGGLATLPIDEAMRSQRPKGVMVLPSGQQPMFCPYNAGGYGNHPNPDCRPR